MSDAKVGAVFVFPNGMVAVTDENGEQIPELQGRMTEELRRKIEARITDETELNGWLATK